MRDIVYVGSTQCGLTKLEMNHRGARELGYTMTKFRKALEEEPNAFKFEWLIYPAMRTELEVLQYEDRVIDKYLPRLNEKYDNTNKKTLDTKHSMRGVYGVTYEPGV
tara:strand:- start:2070 stop:2390 length:321 start_codon:yes stop_codon:yes gene_type:complete